MKELYNKYLESENVLTYDKFSEFVNKLPIKDVEDLRDVEFYGGEALVDLMDVAMNTNFICTSNVFDDDQSVQLQLDYIENPEPLHLSILRNVFKRLEDKGWKIENKEELIEELTDNIESSKIPRYKQSILKFVEGLTDKEAEDFYYKFL